MSDAETLHPSSQPGSLARMHVPPGVEILVDEVFGDDDTSPAVELKELLVAMSGNGIHLAGVVPLSARHVIVIGYRDPRTGKSK